MLIGHWFEKDSAADASKKAFLTNRVGDIGFFIGIMLIYNAIGSFAFAEIFDGVESGLISGTILTFAGLGLFMGAMGKSSQFPLHIWLPDAMEGPLLFRTYACSYYGCGRCLPFCSNFSTFNA